MLANAVGEGQPVVVAAGLNTRFAVPQSDGPHRVSVVAINQAGSAAAPVTATVTGPTTP